MNKVILLGNLARDPEIRYSQGNEPVCVARYTMAVPRRFKREGEQDTDFIYCVSFGKQGEFVERYLKKGMKVSLCGRLQVREYTDNTGQRKWSTEVVAEEVTFAESRAAYEARTGNQSGGYGQSDSYSAPQDNRQSGPPSYEPPEGFSAITQSIDDDDLPF
ncbi:MAG: single-stranded DNA-binding protein [Defluviitaleaceae bacterium]|nr:single-stranded DNA-binding protein [Defluviitaleaceae bacterium]